LKDIKEKPLAGQPKTLTALSRMPKDIGRRGLEDAKERLTQQEQDTPNQPDNPEGYASEKVNEVADEVATRTDHAAQDAGRKITDGIRRKSNIGRKAEEGSARHTESQAHQKGDPTYRGGKRYAQNTAQARRNSMRQAVRSTDSAASGAKQAVRQTAKGSVKTTQRSVKTVNTALKTTGKSIKTAEKTARTAAKAAKETAKVTARLARAAAKAAVQTAKAAIRVTISAIKLAIAAVKGLIAAIAAGGWVVLVIILVVGAVAALLLSPFGILTGGGADGTPTITEAVQMINGELYEKVDTIQSGAGDVAEVRLLYNNSDAAAYVDNWADVLAVFAVRANMDEQNPMDVVVMDDARIALLRETFWDMTSVSHEIEEREAEPTGTGENSGDKDPGTERILIIHINSKSYSEMISVYNFSDDQIKMLEEMMSPDMRKLLRDLTGSDACLRLSSEEIAEIMKTLPADLSPRRLKVVLTAYGLVGKVHYFWGGKSTAIGWDARWGMPRVVTSGNSPTTGTIRPFGLDCSGYVSWVFINAAGTADALEVIGNGSSNQWSKCQAVSWDDALPGDIAWLYVPGSEDVNHVGVVVGTDADGDLLVAHCSSSRNNVVVTKARNSGFRYIRRPTAFYTDE
jgi:hypothetical protein